MKVFHEFLTLSSSMCTLPTTLPALLPALLLGAGIRVVLLGLEGSRAVLCPVSESRLEVEVSGWKVEAVDGVTEVEWLNEWLAGLAEGLVMILDWVKVKGLLRGRVG